MVSLILNNIRSAHNVGSIFRTTDAAGVAKIYLVGYTPAPQDQFGRVNKEIAKTALGAEKTVAWEKVEDIFGLVGRLKVEGVKLVALEQSSNSVDYREVKFKPEEKVAIILGNEVGGIAPEVLKQCDLIAEIPMRGEKESLNVSVAAGVALFRWLD
jgi:23S rRNA (guanosine2251-2'-O)-methyltransferase